MEIIILANRNKINLLHRRVNNKISNQISITQNTNLKESHQKAKINTEQNQ